MECSKIFVITHKKIVNHFPSNYSVLQVGKEISNINIDNAIPDNTGNNISYKNQSYCELTGIYWVWKNYYENLPKYIGIVHYRRFFKNNIFNNYIKDSKIEKIMKEYDVILPEKFYFNDNVWDNYYKNGAGKEKDLKELRRIIYENYPDYKNSFDKIMNSKSASYCNMFIMKKESYFEYCKWLFDILFELEKNIDITNYSKEEKRIYGYLSEILLNIWIDKQKLSIKYNNIVKIDDSFFKRIVFYLRNFKRKICNENGEKF